MSANFNNPSDTPTKPEEVKKFIMKRPYSQRLAGQEITYSILNKKQESFVLTHERFLILKGIESIGYAREFPEKQEVPFRTLEEIPKLKATVPIAELDKC